jgi:hypothetical protein
MALQIQVQDTRRPHQSATHHRQYGHYHRNHTPEECVGDPGNPEGQAYQKSLNRGGQARADQGGDSDIPEPLPQDLGVTAREGDERLDLPPGGLGRQQQVVQSEERYGELDAEPGSRSHQPECARADPGNHPRAKGFDLGADIIGTDPQLPQAGEQWTLDDPGCHILRFGGHDPDKRDPRAQNQDDPQQNH